MVHRLRYPAMVGVRCKAEERAALHELSDSRDLSASALARKYILEGLERDGVKIEG